MIDPTKEYRTRNGQQVRIYSIDNGGQYPVHGAIWLKDDDRWAMAGWRTDGSGGWGGTSTELVEVAQKPMQMTWMVPGPLGDRVQFTLQPADDGRGGVLLDSGCCQLHLSHRAVPAMVTWLQAWLEWANDREER